MTTPEDANTVAGGSPVERRVRPSVCGLTECCGKPMCGTCAALAKEPPKFRRGDHVRKISGAAWNGLVVGEYSTTLTPEGYAVESSAHPGSVQIYPAAALERVA